MRPLPHDRLVVPRQDGGRERCARPAARWITLARFPGAILDQTNQTDFVCTGSEQGKLYGRNGQGTGRMPGFCSVPAKVNDPLNTGEVGVNPTEAAILTRSAAR